MRPSPRTLGRAVRFASAATPLLVACGGSTTGSSSVADADTIYFPSADTGTGGTVDAPAATPDASVADVGAVDAAPPPFEASPPGPGVTAVPLFSCVPSEYTAALTIGGSQVFQLAVDTGSTSLGVASSACTGCAVTPEYTPGSGAVDQHMTATSQYGTGSWTGEIYQDSVGVAGGPSAPVEIVAIDSQSSFFVPAQCDSPGGGFQGIVGMGPAGSAVTGTNGFFDQLVAKGGVANVFATRLCDTGGTLWLGGYDETFMTAAPQWVPLGASLVSSFYYAVNFSSITVAGTSTPIATGQYTDSVVDTGTSIFILPTAAFSAVTAAIAGTPAFAQVFGATSGAAWFSSPSNCGAAGATKASLDATLPPLTLEFGSNPAVSVVTLPTESYLVPYQGEWCAGLYAMDPSPNFPVASIMGSPVLRSSIVIFDRANSRVGFAPHTACP